MMTYMEACESIKGLLPTDVGPLDGPLAIQVHLTDEDCGGTFYIEASDGRLHVEPYDYHNNDVTLTGRFETLRGILSGKTDPAQAVFKGSLHVEGDTGRAMELTKLAKKPTAKKRVTAKKAEDGDGK